MNDLTFIYFSHRRHVSIIIRRYDKNVKGKTHKNEKEDSSLKCYSNFK